VKKKGKVLVPRRKKGSVSYWRDSQVSWKMPMDEGDAKKREKRGGIAQGGYRKRERSLSPKTSIELQALLRENDFRGEEEARAFGHEKIAKPFLKKKKGSRGEGLKQQHGGGKKRKEKKNLEKGGREKKALGNWETKRKEPKRGRTFKL